ncbi:MAG: hypothetical protein ACJARD_000281 [Alphaproteobacteria bacterium]|jgi:hypothetical protein
MFISYNINMIISRKYNNQEAIMKLLKNTNFMLY